jgi:hypothetical protein
MRRSVQASSEVKRRAVAGDAIKCTAKFNYVGLLVRLRNKGIRVVLVTSRYPKVATHKNEAECLIRTA